MAYHHHCHQRQTSVHRPTTTATCCFNSHCCNPALDASPPPSLQVSADQLLQAIVYLIQDQQRMPLHSPQCNRIETRVNDCQDRKFGPQRSQFGCDDNPQQTHFVVSSLLRRINALESSLSRLSPPSTATYRPNPSHSLRDAAARVIQSNFRSFLVCRSRTLGQLKDLAFIRSSFTALKSSVSDKTRFSSEIVSRKAMDLLLKLDSVQGGDPMIRDGKRSISRDLIKFLEFIDDLAVKRRGISLKSTKNASRALRLSRGCGDLTEKQKEIVENLRGRLEKISGFSRVCENDGENVELEGFVNVIGEDDHEVEDVDLSNNNGVPVKRTVAQNQPRVKKAVTFVENRNVCRVYDDSHELVLNEEGSLSGESDSSDGNGGGSETDYLQETKGVSKVIEKDEETVYEQNCDNEKNFGRNLRTNGYCQDQDRSLFFAAPVPVKMEPRAASTKKRTTLKIGP
ncbi:hypothetical protein K2173_020174 [Erythroxylum novogranatense]|uniref:BAG family molecular chaperone regulator 8, chloroplastic n=1 Tax=Erythroxylum novogranatense TaxID=1862640 RepID=A0AAV8UB31_9ROSI|nr:hypothetical protein K2173_020174 [Erythroxylum novogranatense]